MNVPTFEDYAASPPAPPPCVRWMRAHPKALEVLLANIDAPAKTMTRYLRDFYEYPYTSGTMATLRKHFG